MANDANAQKAQNFANRGRQALEAGKFDLAVEMLMQSLAYSPNVLETRRLLRTAQVTKFRRNPPSSLQLKLQKVSNFIAQQKIAGLIKKGLGAEAMAEAEKLLSVNPLDAGNMDIAVRAAEAAGQPEAAAISVEAAYECSGNDTALLERVAQYYTQAKRYDKARDAYQKLAKSNPSDQRVLTMFKNAEAQATMSSGWTEAAGHKGGFRALIKDQEQAKKLDQQNKAVVVGDDADSLIAEKLQQIEREPGNMNYYRALARIYAQNKRFDEAVATLEKAQGVNAMDPELDRMLSQMRTSSYQARIDQAKAEGRSQDEIDQLEMEKNQFVFDDLAARVERYPNDLHLRYELGVQYFTYGYYDEAVMHLQLAQKSPKERLSALYYLAMCFIQKGQLDMGVMQLETARDQIPTMDELKKKIVYQLGLCAESQGDYEKAYAYYKDVYSTDVTFEDLNERMLAISAALREQEAQGA
ncbi:MAG: tetratricopeptide repeat protein [Kiritimatiellae bacterium]|nr:tetratricopeptide repeat protein [Kiritimatiellia bacterium]